MREAIQKVLDQMTAKIDGRTSVFDLRIAGLENGTLSLSGRILEATQLQSLRSTLLAEFPDLKVDTASVRVLAGSEVPCVHVATNLTGLYERPTFSVPLASELYYGTGLEVLDENERWVLVRQSDGYLGWAYRPYLAEGNAPEPTHLVMAPSIEIRSQPHLRGSIVTRLMSGTGVVVEETRGDWARVNASKAGWLPSALLRRVKEFPVSLDERRATIMSDAVEMIGTPYLWGGMSGNGIDCSGLARLLHRWIGIEIPRDADMQHAAARRVEAPFEAGDLFFFGEGEGEERPITHVGISVGGTMLIHSSRTRNGVYLDDLEKATYLREIYVSAGSFLR